MMIPIFFHSFYVMMAIIACYIPQSIAFTNGPSMVQYWGQNSAGATGSGTQQPLGTYCNTDGTDVIVMAFVNTFNIGSLPNMDLSSACKGTFFPGTSLLDCPDVAKDIKACQAQGKKVLLSLGGASGSYGFQNDNDAVTFANTLWDLFGNGKSDTRPFGDAVLDGFDLDIEGGGSTGYVTFVNTLRKLYATDSSKQYYVTAAPQCPFPDAVLGSVIDGASFDAVLVQFYNNYCSCAGTLNFDTWDKWAKGTSPNKDVKVFLGIPGSPQAAGSGYIDLDQLQPILEKVSQYSSFGGVSIWDASQSYENTQSSPNFAEALAKVVHSLGTGSGGGGDTQPSSQPEQSTTSGNTDPSPTTFSPSSSDSSSADANTNAICPSAAASSSGGDGSTLDNSNPTGTTSNSCSEGETTTCMTGNFALCDHGEWNKFSCPSGTGCLSNADTSSNGAYCGFIVVQDQQPTNSTSDDNNCTIDSSTNSLMIKPTSLVKPQVAANLYVASITPSNSSDSNSTGEVKNTFALGINARRLNTRPFGSTVMVQMTVQPNTTITSVQGGTVSQKGRQVTLQIRNKQRKNMALQLQLNGETNSEILYAPDPRTLQFN